MRNERILVIRNDKLGDFMLAWPAFSMLRLQYPEAAMIALVPAYTRPMAELCPSIDEVIIDEPGGPLVADAWRLRGKIRAAGVDVSVSFFSEIRSSLALWLARVPVRAGPATKLAQLFLNHRLRQRRSLSQKPEHVYNCDLAAWVIRLHGDVPPPELPPPFLAFDRDATKQQRDAYREHHAIDSTALMVIVHPGSGGSAVNLSLGQYADLLRRIAAEMNVHYVITAGPDELETANRLSGMLTGLPHSVYHSQRGLAAFAAFIATCDLFISGSTGTLHVAGALDVPTAAFYPSKKSASPLRWQTLNSVGRSAAILIDSGNDNDPDKYIDHCAMEIRALLGRVYPGLTRVSLLH